MAAVVLVRLGISCCKDEREAYPKRYIVLTENYIAYIFQLRVLKCEMIPMWVSEVAIFLT